MGHPCLLPQKSIVGSVVRGRRGGGGGGGGGGLGGRGEPRLWHRSLGRCRGQRGMEGVMCCNMCCPPFKFEPAVSNSVLQPVCIGFCTQIDKIQSVNPLSKSKGQLKELKL